VNDNEYGDVFAVNAIIKSVFVFDPILALIEEAPLTVVDEMPNFDEMFDG
jgi:hypothetical protein